MEIGYLTYLLDAWARWMKHDDHELGYPKRSLGMSSGGASSSFEEIFEDSELDKIRIVDRVIHDLDYEQRKAIYARYLGSNKPMYYEIKLGDAMDNLLTIVGRRIGS